MTGYEIPVLFLWAKVKKNKPPECLRCSWSMDTIPIFWMPICSEYNFFLFFRVLDLFPLTMWKDLEWHLVGVGRAGSIPHIVIASFVYCWWKQTENQSSALLVWCWHLLQHLWLGLGLSPVCSLFMPLFAEPGSSCSGTGQDRAMGRHVFVLLAPC